MSTKRYSLGLHRSLPDYRDLYYSASLSILKKLPPKVDISPSFPVYDQGRIGSCTANAFAGAIQFDRIKAHETPDFVPSRLFIYYNERRLEKNIASDAGANLRDGIRSLHKQGVCPESEWPYDDTPADSKTNLFPPGSKAIVKPPEKCYKDAQAYCITKYERIHQSLSLFKSFLASGYPFAIGFMVLESWLKDDKPSTVIPMPSASDNPEGGHAVLCTGYDDEKHLFKFRNSWGDTVGEKGYFYMPYAYILDKNLAFEFWAINAVKS